MSSRTPSILKIDHEHCRAICEEIGERLQIMLRPETRELPERLRLLLNRFAEMERDPAPSIAPSMEDMMSWPIAPAHIGEAR